MPFISSNIIDASTRLKNNEVIAIPTETVYGLAGNALIESTVKKIFEVKERPLSNPLIVHLPDLDSVFHYVKEISPIALELAKAFWPGPLTLLLPKKDIIPSIVTAGKPDVAVRIPNHPVALELLRQLPFPLAAPSANPFGYISPTRASDVARILDGKIDFILDGGACDRGIESTIVGFIEGKPVVYRAGIITKEQLEEAVGPVLLNEVHSDSPIAPGMLLSHYSPHTALVFTENIDTYFSEHTFEDVGVIVFKDSVSFIPIANQMVLSPSGDLEEAAQNLYRALHQLDGLKLKKIVAEHFPSYGVGIAINDKLKRASFKQK